MLATRIHFRSAEMSAEMSAEKCRQKLAGHKCVLLWSKTEISATPTWRPWYAPFGAHVLTLHFGVACQDFEKKIVYNASAILDYDIVTPVRRLSAVFPNRGGIGPKARPTPKAKNKIIQIMLKKGA